MDIQSHRREKLTNLLNGPIFKNDRGLFCKAASISKGLLSQLLEEKEAFGDVVASNLATSLGLDVGYFNPFDSGPRETSKEDDDVVVPAQSEVKLYLNQQGDIVLSRPLDDWEIYSADQGPNVWIVIPKLFVPRVIERIKTLMAESN